MSHSILLVNNKSDSARLILSMLAKRGLQGFIANSECRALDYLEKNKCGMVFIEDDTESGLRLIKKIINHYPELPVVMIAENTESTQMAAINAVTAIKIGCSDYLMKPLKAEQIEKLLKPFAKDKNNNGPDYVGYGFKSATQYPRIVGASAAFRQTLQIAKKVASTSIPVLLSGESGTGKEVISYFIHHSSKRTDGPYIKVNCASLNESLLESELFGHEKGAFTGAVNQRKGRFEMAHGGTLLLDEITETPLSFQAKLLRVLEQQDFERVGGNENIKVNVRIISTTNRNLLEEVKRGRFREDLYYRLSGLRVIVPSLRQRTEDLPGLVWHFVNLYAKQAGRVINKLDPKMMNMFAKYDWPGNIRQLRNVVLTSLVLGEGDRLELADVAWLFDEIEPISQQQRDFFNTTANLKKNDNSDISIGGIPLSDIEKQAILETLDQTEGNQTKAAKILGISDRTLRDKVKKYKKEKQLQTI